MLVPVVVPMGVAVGLFFVISMFVLRKEKWTCFWLFFTAFIQLFMEFNYGVNHELVRERSTKYFHEFLLQDAEVSDVFTFHWWARVFYGQYTKYDTRYARSDPTIVALSLSELPEAILCYLCIYLIQTGSRWRHPLQMIASAWQFYGTFIYFSVPYLAGTWNSDFDCSPFEFYTYAVGLNGVWFVIPGLLMIQSVLSYINAPVAAVEAKKGAKVKSN